MSLAQIYKSPVASEIPTEDGDSVQDKLDQIDNSASPGFTWGRGGNAPTNTWLLNDGVPSNQAGRRIFLNSAQVVKVFVASRETDTFGIGVYEHNGAGTEVLLGTVNVVAARGGDFDVSYPLTTGKELALRIQSGSAKDIQVGLVIQGALSV